LRELPIEMKALSIIACLLLGELAYAQQVAPFTADAYLVNPSNYLGKEVTLAVAYVMPSTRARSDGMQEFVANTYNLNQFGGHILVIAPPPVAQRLAQQCGTQHVWNHSHTTLIHGTFKKDETKESRYCVFVSK
jgi:hypothetical protein